ncbi:MAG: hypothetical protein C0508_30750, partial [Cyanobacteria bacterium PR.023]|nr:hypothetical protein [Cyanobacteria bacterium PR.023]
MKDKAQDLSIELAAGDRLGGLCSLLEVPDTIGGITPFNLINERPSARLDLITAKPLPIDLPFTLTFLECHPASSQVFFPVGIETYLVVVARDNNGEPDLTTLRAFAIEEGKPTL